MGTDSAIEIVVKSSVILGFTFLTTLALRRKSAALRHTVWTVGLLCSLTLPLFSLVLPAWHVKPIRAVHSSASVIAPQRVTTESGPVVASPSAAVPGAPSRFTPEQLLLLTWLIGMLSVASLLFREAVQLARVAFGASIVQEVSWRELVHDVSHALRLTRHVRLMRNPNASVLGTWGVLRPRVLLPCESESWPDERMRVVLGHELAHVKRNDWLVQVIAEFARAVYWFNPLFWVACTELRRESEHACDDTAMRLGVDLGLDGPTYAGHVLDLARTLKHSAQPASAALAMASTSNLERRLIAMLNPSLNRRVTGNGTVVIVVLLALGLTLPLAAVSSQAPLQASPVIQAVELTPPISTTAMPTAAASPRVAWQVFPKPVALVATASAAAEAAQSVAAQIQGGTLSGEIMDQTGALIPGVRIIMKSQSTGLIRQTLTTSSGNFSFSELPPGTYSGTVELAGFKQGKFLYNLADSRSTARLNLKLQIATQLIVIDIAAQSPPGLKCFSVFGAFKADGTPFTEADCPGGRIVTGPLPGPSAQAPVESSAIDVIVTVDSTPAAGTQSPTQPTGRPYPIRVGGSISAGRLVFHPSPAYPSEARNRGVEGVVVISGTVAADGQFRSLKITNSSNPLLESSVLETIQSWKSEPTLLNREPVEVTTTITLNFTLGR